MLWEAAGIIMHLLHLKCYSVVCAFFHALLVLRLLFGQFVFSFVGFLDLFLETGSYNISLAGLELCRLGWPGTERDLPDSAAQMWATAYLSVFSFH